MIPNIIGIAPCKNVVFTFLYNTKHTMMTPPLHIGQMLRQYVDDNRLSQAAWARRADVNISTITQYLKQPTMRVDTLMAVCEQLDYNFLRDIANTLPPELPPQAPIDQSAELAALKAENAALKIEIAALERAIGLMGKK
jgi:transcriptional regulator with XRE-family HTH domain